MIENQPYASVRRDLLLALIRRMPRGTDAPENDIDAPGGARVKAPLGAERREMTASRRSEIAAAATARSDHFFGTAPALP